MVAAITCFARTISILPIEPSKGTHTLSPNFRFLSTFEPFLKKFQNLHRQQNQQLPYGH